MDRATMLAENKEREREFNLQLAMSAAPPWPVLEYTEEPFAWKHGARALIAERNRVGEIRVLREAMTYEKLKDSNGNYSSQFYHCDMPCSFHEAFIASDDERAQLMHNLHRLYNEQWQKSVVGMHLDSFPKTEQHPRDRGALRRGSGEVGCWRRSILQGRQVVVRAAPRAPSTHAGAHARVAAGNAPAHLAMLQLRDA
jgi:hypothetical protein